jgi:hypothetical protein
MSKGAVHIAPWGMSPLVGGRQGWERVIREQGTISLFDPLPITLPTIQEGRAVSKLMNTLAAGQYRAIRTKALLDGYCARIESHLPAWSSRSLLWLRRPSNRSVRILVSALLVLGGIFSFFPVLGLWMLPLGLIVISQDLPFLQAPLVRAFQWVEARWEHWHRWRKNRRTASSP